MKKILFILFASGVMMFYACKKKESGYKSADFFRERDAGKVTAKINGKPWESSYTLAYYDKTDKNKISINSAVFIGDIQVQALFINPIFLTVGSRIVENSRRLYLLPANDPHRNDTTYATFSLDEHDASVNEYEILESGFPENQLVIDAYNRETSRIRGHFNITFYRSDNINVYKPAEQGFDDTLHFTDGTFDLKVIEPY